LAVLICVHYLLCLMFRLASNAQPQQVIADVSPIITKSLMQAILCKLCLLMAVHDVLCLLPAAGNREIQRLSGELDSQAVRAGVLLDTVETLQAGGSSEREQRLVALTAQLAASKGLAAAQEARIQDLLVWFGNKAVQHLLFRSFSIKMFKCSARQLTNAENTQG
jgi:hypothetical protein